jgi:hypothetical protein
VLCNCNVLVSELSGIRGSSRGLPPPPPIFLRKIFELKALGPDLLGASAKSLIFKEHFAQSIRKTVLGAPGLARAGDKVVLVLVLPPVSIIWAVSSDSLPFVGQFMDRQLASCDR